MRSVLAFCALAMALPPSLAAQDSTKAALRDGGTSELTLGTALRF